MGGEGSHIEHYSEGASGEGIQRIASAYFPLKPASVSPKLVSWELHCNAQRPTIKSTNFLDVLTGEREPEGAVTPTRSTLLANFQYDRARSSSECHYAAVITRIEDEIENKLVWKIVEMARRSARAYV